MSAFLNTIWIIFQIVFAVVLIFPVLSYLFYMMIKPKAVIIPVNISKPDYAILVTAYKDTSNIPNVIKSILKLNYQHFIIYVIADNCEKLEEEFNDDRVVILYPEQVFENQVMSHYYAIENFKREHTHLTIIDSDNLVDPDYLNGINKLVNRGYNAIQGVRTAKNLNTPYACLDAANEIYYFFFNRKILFALGSSSMLAGSGMAFTVQLYKDCMIPENSSGAGFDKIFQKEIILRGHRIAFAEDAIVLDEKTSRPDQLVKQRARWNNTWFKYYAHGLSIMNSGIRNGNINRFLFGFVLSRPPMFMLVILTGLLIFVNLFVSLAAAIVWFVLLIIFIAGFFIALRNSKTDERIYRSLTHVPKFIFLQVFSLFKARKANKYSVATEHNYNKEIEKI